MSAMSTLPTELEEFEAELREKAEPLVEKFLALKSKLLGQVETDAGTLAREAEAAAKPVAADAEADAEQLAKTAAADATSQSATAAATTPPAAPSSTPQA